MGNFLVQLLWREIVAAVCHTKLIDQIHACRQRMLSLQHAWRSAQQDVVGINQKQSNYFLPGAHAGHEIPVHVTCLPDPASPKPGSLACHLRPRLQRGTQCMSSAGWTGGSIAIRMTWALTRDDSSVPPAAACCTSAYDLWQ